ncbi:ion channel protein AlgE [Pseudomonas costantinii]|uniref:Alginate production protein n=1 Tax=Pseudomonas costantinii TaxID=168469 RepID=A0A1S2V399_9PSED|nr:ion channel protein AlgE [Pseudomonas costantinii]NVZ20814.1 ion channel protein AlgE [Pseudomonas costantinii]OIN53197.1 ion channel protein AlgE [Pseudomonas costantinii]SED20216.1 alginate production protein [Pseudomonas costantinii]
MKPYSPLYSALLILAFNDVALAAEEVTGPETDSLEPVRMAPADGSQPPITSEFFNKLTLQGGFGPENSEIGNGRESFYSLRYEPSFAWYSPEKRWAKWQVYGRVWLDYDSNQSASLVQNETNQNNASNRKQPQGFYAEFRELYVKRNLLWDDPRFSVSAGRQRFNDEYGIWWDDSIESVRFNYTDTFSHAFVAVAQKFYHYNTDVNTLDDTEKNIFYAMGEYAYRWSEHNWVGARLMYEDDKSNHDVNDRYDFTGVRSGLFFKGDRLTFTPLLSDYHLEAISLNGKMDRTSLTNSRDPSSQTTTRNNHSDGWAVLGEVGKRFDDLAWTPRVALRGGLTDKTHDDTDGFRLNDIQSDRITQAGAYSTRLVSSFVSLNLRNVQYYGVALETRPTARSRLDFRVTDLKLRDQDGPLPIRVDANQRSARNAQINNGGSTGGRSVGQMYDVNYYWKMFPLAYEGKRFDVNGLITASYLKAGNALTSGDDYQISFGVVMSY